MTDTKTLLIAQLLIACMMAFCMTGLFQSPDARADS